MEKKKVLTVNEAAEAVGCHPITIRRAIRAGKLVAANIGGRAYKITAKDLQAWYKAQGGGELFTKDSPPKPLALEEVAAALNEIVAPVALHEDAWSMMRREYDLDFVERDGQQIAAVELERIGLVLWGSPYGFELWAMPVEQFEQFMEEYEFEFRSDRARRMVRVLLGKSGKEKK